VPVDSLVNRSLFDDDGGGVGESFPFLQQNIRSFRLISTTTNNKQNQ
jgi:hypothetical protein